MLRLLREESNHLRHTLVHLDELAAKLWDRLRDPDQQLRLSLVGGTAGWALYQAAAYALTSLACRWGWFGVPDTGAVLKLIQVLLAVAALAVVGGAAYLGLRTWRVARPATGVERGETQASRISMLGFVFLLLNCIYLAIILTSLAPVLVLPACVN